MSLVTDKDVEQALTILADEAGAASRAAHEYFDSLTKSVLAELMQESNETSAAAKEAWARAQPKFIDHLKQVGKFAREDYSYRQRYAAADAKIRIWQTMSANSRGMERVR